MKIQIKTLKGELFSVDAEGNELISDVKLKIQDARSDLLAPRQKLIHSGKILKDEQSVSELGISESDFIVCMITKEIAKKPTPTPAPIVAPSPVPAAVVAPTPVSVPVISGPSAEQIQQYAPQGAIDGLVSMGFPADESRAALIAAMGNPDLAYEFLLSGIPPQLQQGAVTTPSTEAAVNNTTSPAVSTGPISIEALRAHPQFNMLKQLIQQNPAALPQVLESIGLQNPALLEAIHANNDAFIAMMNEPITNTPPPAAANTTMPSPTSGMGGMPDPAAMMQMLAALPAPQRAAFAQQLGMSPEQLDGVMQMMASMPPGQMESMLGQVGSRSGGGTGGMDPPGVIRLTHEEMESVNRLVALGFTQQQAAQAYLACDKNETLAANLLFDGTFGDDDGGYGSGGGFGDDNMYN